MLIAKRSPITGKIVKRELPITVLQILRWQNGELIQNVMSHLTTEEREFLITGMSDQDWDDLFGEEE